uniref:CSON015464 protein n=1 Tax=Culicoides sonorensis TaxID=179676 RepID=A0A336MDB4_CULSO
MSNGVEVIVAGDKSTLPGDPSILRILPNSIYKPYTLPASTLKNNVLMMLPSEPELDEISASLIPNQFVTKTCLTTFTYLTTYMQDGKTKVESREKVISNIATEERNTAFNIVPTPTAGILLSQTPNLAVGEFHTTYTYLNTILDGDLPIVVTSKHTVTNTITAPDDYLSLLQPSEQATPVYDTNTYLSTISLTKTLNEDEETKVLSSTDVLTQVVITEFLPPGKMSSYLPFISGDHDIQGAELIQTTDVVKTYFVTYTYYNTIMEDGKTILKSNVSTSSDVVTEKLYLYPKKTVTPINVNPSGLEKKTKVPNLNPFQIYSTKTYMTTFTYFTTVLHKNDQQVSSTVVNSHTKVVENVKTETVPSTLLPDELVKKLKKSLRKDVFHTGITTLATLLDKQTIEITAVSNAVKPTKKISPSKSQYIEASTSVLKQEKPSGFTALPTSNEIKPSSIKTTPKPQIKTSVKPAIKTPTKKPAPIIKDEYVASGSNLVSQIVTKNNTKVNKIKPAKPDLLGNVPDLLGSFNMDRFSALSPLIDTMAGLIQNNFLGGSKNKTTAIPVKHVHEHKPNNNNNNQQHFHHQQNQHHNHHHPNQEHLPTPQASNFGSDSPKISANDVVPATDPQNRSPIYIPVGGGKGPKNSNSNLKETLEHAETQVIETSSFNGFNQPPGAWIAEEDQRNRVNQILGQQSHTAGIGGGIPISPGEIINTNADVIVGRPGLIGPRVPYNSRINEVPIGMQPPPLPVVEHVSPTPIPLSNVEHQDSTLLGTNVNENYIGPPPPMTKQSLNDMKNKLQQQQQSGQNVQNQGQSNQNQGPLIHNHGPQIHNQGPSNPHHGPPIHQQGPPIHNQGGQVHNQGKFPPHIGHQVKTKEHPKPLIIHGNARPPFRGTPPRPHHHGLRLQPKPSHDFGNELFHAPPPGILHNQKHNHENSQQQQQQQLQQDQLNNVPLPTNQNEVIHQSETDPSQVIHNQNLQFINQNHGQVFEIQKAPAVFSTDLPPIMSQEPILHHPDYNDHNNQYHVQETGSPDIKQTPSLDNHNHGQPLFVNIQPSQVASVIIPQGSSSALVFGGATEPHKKGEYIDDPLPYQNTHVGLQFSGGIGFDSSASHNQPNIEVVEPNNDQSFDFNLKPDIKPSLFTEQQLPTARPPPPFRGDLKIPDYHSNVHITGDNLEISVSPLPIIVPSNEQEAQQVVNQGLQGHVSDAKLPNEYNNLIHHSGHQVFNQHQNHPSQQPQRPHYVPGHVKDVRLHPSLHRPTLIHTRPSNVGPFKQMPKHNPQTYSMFNMHVNKGRPFNRIPTGQGQNGGQFNPPNLNPVPNPVEYMTPPQYVPEHDQTLNNNNNQEQNIGNMNAGPPIIPFGHPEAPHFNPFQENEVIQNVENEKLPDIPIVDGPDNDSKGSENVVIDSNQDHHKEDDVENEHGEVVQESNNVPHAFENRTSTLPSIPSYEIQTPSSTEQPSSSEIPDYYRLHEYENSQKINEFNLIDNGRPTFIHSKPPRPQITTNSNNRPQLHYISIPKRPTSPPRLEVHYPRRPGTINKIPPVFTGNNNIRQRPQIYYHPSSEQSSEEFSLFNVNAQSTTQKAPTTHETTTGVTTFNINVVHDHHSTTHSHKHITRKPVTSENNEILLNTGEIMKETVDEKEKHEIFDSKETQNPHNYGSIEIEYENMPQRPSIDILPPKKEKIENLIHHQEAPIYYEMDGSISTPQPFLPKPSENMRPPPPVTHQNTVTIFHAPKPTTPKTVPKDSGEVLGMSPPSLVVKVESVRDHSRFPIPMIPPSKFTKAPSIPLTTTTQKPPVTKGIEISSTPGNRRPTFSVNMYVTPTSTEKIQVQDFQLNQFNRTYTNMNRRPATPSRSRDPSKRPGFVINEKPLYESAEIVTNINNHDIENQYPNHKIMSDGSKSINRYQHSTIKRTRPTSTSAQIAKPTFVTINRSRETSRTRNIQKSPVQETSSTRLVIEPSTVTEPTIITSHSDIGLNDGEMYVNIGFGGAHASDDYIIYGSETPDFDERPNIITKEHPVISESTTENEIVTTPSTVSEIIVNSSVTDAKPATIFDNLYVKKEEDSIESESTISKIERPSTRNRTTAKGRDNNRLKLNIRPISKEPKQSSTSVERINSKIILPTKYITNTKTLTITTTKTTVVRSQGIPSTQVLTKTYVSTVLDTITETHTLVQPTRITIHATPTTKHVTTTLTATTSIIEHHFPNYPPLPPRLHNSGILTDHPHSSYEDDETDLDEFIIEPNADRLKPHSTSSSVMGVSNKGHGESIFVVMTDQNKSGVLKIEPSMIETQYPKKTKVNDFDNEIATRDEPSPEDVNHVLLGGILIASSPPKLDSNINSYKNKECKPECIATKNEVCQRSEGLMKCVCRPGFARMFPDRPCKPTYTYAMKLALDRSGKETLVFDPSLSDPTSPSYAHLVSITHEGLDRTAMQSELRDIYHGIHVQGFEEIPQQSGIFSNFYLQLSDNINEKRLVDIFKQYLMHHNYSLGGTNLFAARPLNELEAADFDECQDSLFHDCSVNAQCFNLRGTYTCSCLQGYADLSENPLYPGRKCSAEQMGCEKCHYHGTCVSRGDEQQICECFQWYTGASCHINLKVLLIGLVTLGLILLVLLFICCTMTCCKGKRTNAGHLPNNIGIIPHRATSSHHSFGSKIDKRAMINNIRKSKTPTRPAPPKIPKAPSVEKKMIVKPKISTMEQRDRSLTVMIPRAKYHPVAPNSSMDIEYDRRSASVCSTTEAKLLNYLDASPSTSKNVPPKKKTSPSSSKSRQPPRHSMSTGALVSAGFEVSASGGSSSNNTKRHLVHKVSTISEHTTINQSTIDDLSIIKKSHSHGDLIDSMDDWLEHVPHNDMRTVSEARSYDETTIQAPTKSLRSIYDKQSSHMNNDVSTM